MQTPNVGFSYNFRFIIKQIVKILYFINKNKHLRYLPDLLYRLRICSLNLMAFGGAG
jgi:hypothetical protein